MENYGNRVEIPSDKTNYMLVSKTKRSKGVVDTIVLDVNGARKVFWHCDPADGFFEASTIPDHYMDKVQKLVEIK